MGTSVGAMHTWVWGSLYPEAMDALMPLANAPVKIAGRNRMFRAMIIQAARDDPEWKGGEYTARRSANGLRNLRAVHDLCVQKQSHAGTSLV